MKTGRCIQYTPCCGTTAEAEISALAAVYRFVLDCRAKKEAATKDAAVIGHQEVSHVEQQPD